MAMFVPGMRCGISDCVAVTDGGNITANLRIWRVMVQVMVLTFTWSDSIPKPVKFWKTGIYDGSQ
jgi:hypothetical protein